MWMASSFSISPEPPNVFVVQSMIFFITFFFVTFAVMMDSGRRTWHCDLIGAKIAKETKMLDWFKENFSPKLSFYSCSCSSVEGQGRGKGNNDNGTTPPADEVTLTST